MEGDNNLTTVELLRILRDSERSVGKEMHELTKELQETCKSVKQYNGLRPMIDRLSETVAELAGNLKALSETVSEVVSVQQKCNATQSANYSMSERIRLWGGWIVALLSLGLNMILAVRLFAGG